MIETGHFPGGAKVLKKHHYMIAVNLLLKSSELNEGDSCRAGCPCRAHRCVWRGRQDEREGGREGNNLVTYTGRSPGPLPFLPAPLSLLSSPLLLEPQHSLPCTQLTSCTSPFSSLLRSTQLASVVRPRQYSFHCGPSGPLWTAPSLDFNPAGTCA